MRLLALVLFGMSLSACTHGPRRDDDSALDHLNGANYREQANILGVPVIERQPTKKNLLGKLLLVQEPLPLELKFKTLALKQGDREIQRVMTDARGEFRFSGEFPNGKYTIQLISDQMHAERVVDVNRNLVDDVRILVP